MVSGHASAPDAGEDIAHHITRLSAPTGDAPGHIVVPDTELLLSAKYSKAGADLVLTGADGEKFVIADYFNREHPADLVAPGGAALSAATVEKLTVSETAGQYAQVGAPAGAAAIGKIERLGGYVTVQHANGTVEELKVGDTLRQGDVIQTGDGSQVGFSLADGTAFNMGAGARMVLSELSYDAGSTSNASVFSLVKGSISFVAGKVARTGDMRVETPVATMGIRGTTVNTNISTDVNGNIVSVTYSLMADPDGHVGSFNILDRTTGAIIGTVTATDTSFVVTPTANLGILATQVGKTPEQIAQELSVAQALFPIFLANPANFDQQNLNVNPQDQPTKSGSVGSSQVFAGGSQTLFDQGAGNNGTPNQNNPSPEFNTHTDPGPGLPGDHTPQLPVTNVTLHTNAAPSIFADVAPPHLVEAATVGPGHVTPGTSTSVAHLFKSDIDGTVSYNVAALLAAGWVLQSTGVYAKDGQYGKAVLDTGANTLTYMLDNQAADPLNAADHPTEIFNIPVIDDQGATALTHVVFTVDGADDAPKITGGPIAFVNVAENTAGTFTTVHATDVDSADLTYAILSGPFSPDAQKFVIDPHTGELSFNAPPDYEHPTDPLHLNVYTIQVQVSDGTFTDTQTLFIRVTNVNEAPVLSPGAAELCYTENDPALQLIPAATVTDPDHPFTFFGGSVDVRLDGAVAGDELTLAGGFGSHVSVFHDRVYVDGVQVGTLSGNHTDHLTVNFNSLFATDARVEQVLHAISFDSTSNDPTGADRTAFITFSDGGNGLAGGALTDTATVTIHVAPVNDAPHAGDDRVVTNETGFYAIPKWALLANDSDPDSVLHIGGITSQSGFDHVNLNPYGGNVLIDDNGYPGGSFNYRVSDGDLSDIGHVSVTHDSGTMNGTSASEIFIGNDHGTTINAGGGNDILIGNGGNDLLNGGSGNDTYAFGLFDGHDTIVDSSGNDTIRIDTAGCALDHLSFAEGFSDNLIIRADNLQITVANHFAGGNDIEQLTFVGGQNGGSFAGYDLGGTYNLSNDSGHFRIGTSGNDILAGDNAPNVMHGGAGNDLIFAGGGGDTINGGTGNDLLVGGAGADTFIFSANFGHDTIAGFQAGCDAVQFDAGLFSCVADILAHIANDCQGNAVLTLDADNSVTFHDVTKEILEAHQSGFHLIA